ncbi:MAG: hypothetical protein B9S33_05440 [Pedosphaera sp. Tous-C6FEB]|nr:MAG: hypothetical protein B9S33_05440 [Pedosphaera sp. Tous-C6FEB]
MIHKLPGWVWFGAAALSFIAGIVNAVGFLGFQHQGVTHLTGTTTLSGIALAQHDFAGTLHLLAVAIAFVFGATVSGFVIQGDALKLGRRYGVALVIESALLAAAVPLLKHHNVLGDFLASGACGLQNAMTSTYSGTVLRTTHVSGVFTDLGIFFGHLLRGASVDWRRFQLWMVLLGSFLTGGVVGAVVFARFSYSTLYFPASLTGLVGLAYSLYRQHKLKQPAHPSASTQPHE